VQNELRRLISDSEKWIARFLAEGRSRGEIKRGEPSSLARLWYAALQGALLVARTGTSDTLREVATVLRQLTLNTK
jgi:hypothetical protein